MWSNICTRTPKFCFTLGDEDLPQDLPGGVHDRSTPQVPRKKSNATVISPRQSPKHFAAENLLATVLTPPEDWLNALKEGQYRTFASAKSSFSLDWTSHCLRKMLSETPGLMQKYGMAQNESVEQIVKKLMKDLFLVETLKEVKERSSAQYDLTETVYCTAWCA